MYAGVTNQNFTKIKAMIDDGVPAEIIARRTNIDLKCIEGYVERYGKKPAVPKKVTRTRRKAAPKPKEDAVTI